MEAGVAKVDITPPVGVELCGYGLYLNRKSTNIRDRLYSKALVLSDGIRRIAIVANDLIGLNRKTTRLVRSLVTEETGIPEDHVLLACSHTHHGPATVFLRECGRIDGPYLEMLPKYIAQGIATANSSLQEAEVGAGIGRLGGFCMNRVEEGGLIDPEVGVIRVDDAHNNVLALLMSFSCHPVVMPINTWISGDFPGSATSIIETAKEGAVGMFLQGACGDINPVLTWSGEVEKAGASLAAEVSKVGEGINTSKAMNIESRVRDVMLPLDIPSAEQARKMMKEVKQLDEKQRRVYGEWMESTLGKMKTRPKPWLETEIQAIRIGDTVLAAEPSEMFVEFCLEVKRRSSYSNTFVVGYANDYVGYIPDEEDYKRNGGFGGYAASMVPILRDDFCFSPNVGRVITEAMVDLIQSLI